MSVKIVAEIGINHNGIIQNAIDLAEIARDAGCDYVKFQKRTPDLCVPESQKDIERDTPWGRMSYLEYRKRIEFDEQAYKILDARIGPWFASVWDQPSVEFIKQFDPPYIKIPSAKLTDWPLIRHVAETGKPIILSTGMSTIDDINKAMSLLLSRDLILMHTVSCYPLEDQEVNLRAIPKLARTYGYPVGFSDHTRGLHMACAAVALGAVMIEKHITLDRTEWGTDHAASLEPHGLKTFVRNIRAVEAGMGNGKKVIQECEKPAMEKLRG